MHPFATLLFDDQIHRIHAVVASGDDPRALLREAGGLADAEPFTRLLEALALADRLDDVLLDDVSALLEALPDPSLAHVYERAEPLSALENALLPLTMSALKTWSLKRISALSFLARWQRRRDPESHAAVLKRAELRSRGEPDEDSARWLFFLSGSRLVALAEHETWAPVVARAVEVAIEALARAPKSISQANAESLLSRSVYADPGHFFFELLQNADDAGATGWHARVEAHQVVITHDGAPFSFRDLVGMLSIGQTTKLAEQIGFFGVGFKSVYEVCERPRVHSGVFDFEIAHVSIARRLTTRPERAAAGATLLVLPYRESLDESSVASLHGRALALPPETLLTLPHLRSMSISGPDGATRTWKEQDRENHNSRSSTALRVSTTLRSSSGETRAYRRVERVVAFEGERPLGRPLESPVLIAIRLDESGHPIANEGPSIFSFLPTAERSGIQVLVHARFDVTLDRERLERDSSWNEWLLREAGTTAAEGLLELAVEGEAIAAVLPTRAELAPWASAFGDALRDGLFEQACLPRPKPVSRDVSELVAPCKARLLSAPLTVALAALDLGDGDRALCREDPRLEAVALFLGARPFGSDDLPPLIERELSCGDEDVAWLSEPVLASLAEANVEDAVLRALPLLLDGRGRLQSAAVAMVAAPEWVALYRAMRPLVLLAALDRVPRSLSRRLAVASFSTETAISDLWNDTFRAELVGRADALLCALATMKAAQLNLLSDLPLIESENGNRVPVSGGLRRLEPALEDLREHLGVHLPFVSAERLDAHRALLEAWVRPFGIPELADWLESGETLSEAGTDLALEVLDRQAAWLGHRLVSRFAALPLFEDRAGSRRPLVGPGRAPRSLSEALRRHLPEWPWLAQPSGDFVEAARSPEVDALAIARALVGAGDLPPMPVESLRSVLGWLAARARELPASALTCLADAPVWLDRENVPRGLGELCPGDGSAAVASVLDTLGTRRVAHPAFLDLASAFSLRHHMPSSDLRALVDDLVGGAEVSTVDPVTLASVLEEAADNLRPGELRALCRLPLFLDEEGVARALGAWPETDVNQCHRAGSFRSVLSSGALPLLSQDQESLLRLFLSAVGPEPASVSDLVHYARDETGLVSDPTRLLEVFCSHADRLDTSAKDALAQLPLFADREGALRPATQLTARPAFERTLGEERLRALGLASHFFGDATLSQVEPLGLRTRPGSDLLEQELLPMFREGSNLSEQRAPWRTVDDFVALSTLVHELGLDLLSHTFVVDVSGRVVRGPLMGGSAAVRGLVESLDAGLIDGQLEAALKEPLARVLVRALPVRRVAQALRDLSPEADLDPASLYGWIREHGDAIEADPMALGALGAASVLPSQRGSRRAPRELVLDPGIPDIGLEWGVAAEVPADVTGWLARVFPFERKQRRALVEELLAGLDEAARGDDPGRSAELVSFLARALGAGEVGAAELETRVRRLGVRKRLAVPLFDAGWGKPRHAWTASAADAARVATFLNEVPPRIGLPDLDEPVRSLLAACGAHRELEEALVSACLDGDKRLPGTPALVALAGYVIDAVGREPALAARWKLSTRRWVPNRLGEPRRASTSIWPDPVALGLLGETHDAWVHPDVIFAVAAEPVASLGFRSAADLTLADVAAEGVPLNATADLLDWLETGLATGRFEASAVRDEFRHRLLLLDDDGRRRPATELAHGGAQAAFGSWRGDYRSARERPRLRRALGIPVRPGVEMTLAFMIETGACLEELSELERAELSQHLPGCLERLGDAVEGGRELRLREGMALAGLRGSAEEIVQLGDPRLFMLEPTEIAAMLPTSTLEAVVDPLPALDRGRGVRQLLFEAGVADLYLDFVVDTVTPGPRLRALDTDAESLHATLTKALRQRVGTDVRIVESLTLDGTLTLLDHRCEASLPCEAVVHDERLWLTPEALRNPSVLAPWLAPEPSRRVAMRRWLDEGDLARAPAPEKRSRGKEAKVRDTPESEGWLAQRMRRWFGGDGGVVDAPASRRRRTAEVAPSSREQAFFQPQSELAAQLGGGDGWLESRRERPELGFAFNPPRLEAPWLYAPKLVALHFDRRAQRWLVSKKPGASPLQRPAGTPGAGHLVLDGKLPAGASVLPVPVYGRLDDVRAENAKLTRGPDGSSVLRLERSTRVRLQISLLRVSNLERCGPAPLKEALTSFVPDGELPDEALDAVSSLDPEASPLVNALALRDFVRSRYRYDPSYLEDPSVSRFLARLARGRANAHIAALHAGADASHLGAGVCYELNTLVVELMRRAQIPAAVATGWVLDGGSLSEPDHLWAFALLQTPEGEPAWIPIDASTTRRGRPLRIARRPPGRFRAPRDPRAKAPDATPWDLDSGPRDGRRSGRRAPKRQRGGSASEPARRSARKRRRAPRGELLRLLHYLEAKTGRELSEPERDRLEAALLDEKDARRMLERLLEE